MYKWTIDWLGGTCAPDFVKDNFLGYLKGELATQPSVPAAISSTYQKLDAKFFELHRDNDSGTTVASLLIDRTNKVFHAAWCGDSRLVHVSEEGKSNWASNDHNPNRVDEAAAIRERGGTIVMGKMYRNGIYEDISRVNSNQRDYQLAVSRAIGDHPWRKSVV